MKLIIIRVLLFCLVPLGAFILYQGIRLLRRTFSGKVILEIPFSQKTGFFEITEPGVYTIWQKGDYLKKMPLDKFKPVIYDTSSNKKIKIIPSIFRPGSNDGKTIKMEIFHFRINPGKYSIELAEGTSVSALEMIISSIVPAGMADLNKYYIMVRESQPFFYLVAGIIILVASSFLILGGLISGILIK